MSGRDPATTVRHYLASFAGGDPDAIAAHVTEDFVNAHHSALGAGCTGRDEYRRRLPGFLAQLAGVAYEVEQLVVDGGSVAAAYRLTATDDGRPVEVHGVMLFEVVDGLIARRTDYWDALGYLRQIGAAPS